jgi:DNA-binding NarL/FixJ family response regulator
MNKIIQIGIADDHKLLRQGLIALLSEYDHLHVMLEASNGKELMKALTKDEPDIIILDIEMPEMDGKEALTLIRAKYPKIKVMMMSMHFNDAYIVEFIQNGACAFLPKNCDIDKILDAVQAVHEVGCYYDSKVSKAMADLLKRKPIVIPQETDAEFTPREVSIIRLICTKRTNLEISEILNLSIRTVEGHRHNISKKANVNNVTDLIEYVTSREII